ncbi:MAG: hypothetical protein U0930_25225 [Pirellulales bacterium]
MVRAGADYAVSCPLLASMLLAGRFDGEKNTAPKSWSIQSMSGTSCSLQTMRRLRRRLHLGFEELAVESTRSPLDYLESVRDAISLPFQVVGGLSIADCIRAFEMGAHSLAIGSPFVPGDAGSQLVDDLRRIIQAANSSTQRD